MAFFNITSKNVKFTVIESENSSLDENGCFIEIVVHRKFLNSIFRNLAITNESSFDGDITLTKREREVLRSLSCGRNNTQIATELNVSVHTAKLHVHNIFNKLAAQDRTEAVVKAIKYKLLEV